MKQSIAVVAFLLCYITCITCTKVHVLSEADFESMALSQETKRMIPVESSPHHGYPRLLRSKSRPEPLNAKSSSSSQVRSERNVQGLPYCSECYGANYTCSGNDELCCVSSSAFCSDALCYDLSNYRCTVRDAICCFVGSTTEGACCSGETCCGSGAGVVCCDTEYPNCNTIGTNGYCCGSGRSLCGTTKCCLPTETCCNTGRETECCGSGQTCGSTGCVTSSGSGTTGPASTTSEPGSPSKNIIIGVCAGVGAVALAIIIVFAVCKVKKNKTVNITNNNNINVRSSRAPSAGPPVVEMTVKPAVNPQQGMQPAVNPQQGMQQSYIPPSAPVVSQPMMQPGVHVNQPYNVQGGPPMMMQPGQPMMHLGGQSMIQLQGQPIMQYQVPFPNPGMQQPIGPNYVQPMPGQYNQPVVYQQQYNQNQYSPTYQ